MIWILMSDGFGIIILDDWFVIMKWYKHQKGGFRLIERKYEKYFYFGFHDKIWLYDREYGYKILEEHIAAINCGPNASHRFVLVWRIDKGTTIG